MSVGEQLPLKQGLKLDNDGYRKYRRAGWRATSIKTRIETPMSGNFAQPEQQVGEQLPLKQGLKLHFPFSQEQVFSRWRATSIKTRIETIRSRRTNY